MLFCFRKLEECGWEKKCKCFENVGKFWIVTDWITAEHFNIQNPKCCSHGVLYIYKYLS